MTAPTLLFTDLDRTLLPNGAAEESPGVRALLGHLVEREVIRLHFVTGRDLVRVEQAIAEYNLPRPEAIIADVGTAIYQSSESEGRSWKECLQWKEEILGDWNNLPPSRLAAALGDLTALRLQDLDRQGPAKLSYIAPGNADPAALREAIGARLASLDLRFHVIWSFNETTGEGLVDIVPESASKWHGIEFLLRLRGIDQTRAVFAGDSGNDLDVLVSPLPSILVANASTSIKSTALRGAAASGHEKMLYIARGGFLGFNGNYAGGILEGLAALVPTLSQPIREAWLAVSGGER